ncbi:MAG: methylated-DNA--[protein]-cysteine S-methyltransferase [Nakamurella sp.]
MTKSSRNSPRPVGPAPTGTAPTSPAPANTPPAAPVLVSTVSTVAGPFTVIVIRDSDGVPTVLASGWTDNTDDLLPLIAPKIRPQSVTEVPKIDGVTDKVLAYHAGDVHAIDDVRVHQSSGEFLEHAWDVLRLVDAGHPVTYTEFAERSGRPRAVRAAGSACSRNAAALFVPCHRVVPTGGGVGHFRWGSSVKQWLLDHEAGTV